MTETVFSPSTLPIPTTEQPLAKHFDVLSPYPYLADFTTRAKLAQRTVAVQSMYIDADTIGFEIEKMLIDAAAQEIEATACSDYFALMVSQEQMHLLPIWGRQRQHQRKQLRANKELFDRMTKNGVNVVIRNKPGFWGRKFPAVDRAIELVDKAEESICFVNPLTPDGPFKLRAAFYRAQARGVDVKIVSAARHPLEIPLGNTALLMDWATSMAYRLLEATTRQYLAVRHYNLPIHDKLLITDREVMFGSHNFSYTGVLAGTQERSIQSLNPVLMENLKRHFNEVWIQSKPMTKSARG